MLPMLSRKEIYRIMKKPHNLGDYITEHKTLKIIIVIIAAIISASILFGVLVAGFPSLLTTLNAPEYYDAFDLYYEEKYEDAKFAFEALLKHAGNPKRIMGVIEVCDQTMEAINLYNGGNYEEAKLLFTSLLTRVYNHSNLTHWIEKCDEALKRN